MKKISLYIMIALIACIAFSVVVGSAFAGNLNVIETGAYWPNILPDTDNKVWHDTSVAKIGNSTASIIPDDSQASYYDVLEIDTTLDGDGSDARVYRIPLHADHDAGDKVVAEARIKRM
ncbi:MAG: hypothetical protein ACYSR0_08715, partial [Planctomycetota bacterium]